MKEIVNSLKDIIIYGLILVLTMMIYHKSFEHETLALTSRVIDVDDRLLRIEKLIYNTTSVEKST